MHSLLRNPEAKKLIFQALEEDIGTGDLTTNSIVKYGQKLTAKVNSRAECVVSGIDVLKHVFYLLDPDMKFEIFVNDGEIVTEKHNIAVINGRADAILTGERTALNFIQRMSAIATLTHKYQEAIKPYRAKVTDTRKTTPNFRIFEKYSVKVGGGSPHRFGLYDAVMIKDNHIQVAGSLTEAIKLVKKNISHTTKIEVETDTIDQVKEAISLDVDVIMLDNMNIDTMRKAVGLIDRKIIVEASGNVTIDTINAIASTGVDYISTSAITARAGIVDIGLDV